jgi:type III secretory pathway component EscR
MTTRVQQTSGITARIIATVGFAVLLTLLLAAPATVAVAETVTDANVAELTATAKTAADHEALAAYYQEEAKEASAEAKFHENMLRRWSGPAPGKQSFNAMKPHCERLIKSYQEAAESYEALAKLHTQLAEEAQK